MSDNQPTVEIKDGSISMPTENLWKTVSALVVVLLTLGFNQLIDTRIENHPKLAAISSQVSQNATRLEKKINDLSKQSDEDNEKIQQMSETLLTLKIHAETTKTSLEKTEKIINEIFIHVTKE